MAGRPRGREKNVSGSGSVFKQGGGLGLGGPVGNSGRGGGISGRPIGGGGSSGGGPLRSGGGMGGCGMVIVAAIAIIMFLFRSCASMMGGGSLVETGGSPSTYSSSGGSGSTYSGSGSSGSGSGTSSTSSGSSGYSTSGSSGSGSSGSGMEGIDLSSLFSFGGSDGYLNGGGYSTGSSSSGSGSSGSSTLASGSISNNNGKLNTSVSSSARDKYTTLKKNGTATVMVYMCGADLESSYGMGTSDLKEMTTARMGDNVNVLVYTGGCRKWQNRIVSNSVNEIYRVRSGGLERLENNFAKKSMTDPDSLTAFIKYASKNYPADRYDLILWDHGCGTSGGYGNDEKFPTSGSMSLDEIDEALENAGLQYDFIGFDACLMATLENALMLSKHADYLIASEETEPGTGWYYGNWLGALSSNTAISTPELGKVIADDFLAASQKVGQGNEVTLSVTDLSELGETVPSAFVDFSKTTLELISNDEYSTVSKARKASKEFAASNRLDQIDVSDFALKLGNSEGRTLAEAVKSAVKYNRTSRSYGDAHGLSIYFPYRKVSYLDRVVAIYKKIGMDSDYTDCIRKFANMEVSGQAAGGGTWNPYSSLFGEYSTGSGSSGYGSSGYGSSGYGSSGYGSSGYGSSGYGSSGYSSSGSSGSAIDYSELFGGSSYGGLFGNSSGSSSSSDITQILLESLLSGGYGRISGLGETNTRFIEEDSVRSAADYVADHHINLDHLKWVRNRKGQNVLAFTEDDWEYVQDAELSVLYDDGEGFIDLGKDAILEYDDNDALIGEYDNTWMALDGNPIAFYHLSTIDDGENYSISGYSPIFLNGQLADLLITFDNDTPEGRVEGVRYRYTELETLETQAQPIAKNALLKDGDEITFICDYYTYEGEFIDNYQLGNTMVVNGTPKITNVDIGSDANAAYCITDIYNESYWTPIIE